MSEKPARCVGCPVAAELTCPGPLGPGLCDAVAAGRPGFRRYVVTLARRLAGQADPPSAREVQAKLKRARRCPDRTTKPCGCAKIECRRFGVIPASQCLTCPFLPTE